MTKLTYLKHYGRLTILREVEPIYKNNIKRRRVECICVCGMQKVYDIQQIKCGKARSCGCLATESKRAPRTHGNSYCPEYRVWAGMKTRCHNKNDGTYKNYGAKGISVCERWFNSFAAFLEDMGKRPSPKHQIDRIDYKGDYSPENCRWIDTKGQARNKSNNKLITHDGVTRCLAEWADIVGISSSTINARLISGWPVAKALLQPLTKSL